ncbi:MAG TPA: hypothetical protein VNT53_11315 [Pseudolysinimonas sp.]|nr:hypothetical protein [Pseudolysinimonas sp.]
MREKITLVAAVLLPPFGLVAAIAAAVLSRSRRGWVIGLLKAAIALGIITTVIAVFGGVAAQKAIEAQRTHAAVEAASAKFCATIAKQPDMVEAPTFGWPKPAASIPDSIAAMQAYADRWAALAKVSPKGIRADVQQMSAAATQVIESVTVSRTVDDAGNIAVMTQAASSTAIPQWADNYC